MTQSSNIRRAATEHLFQAKPLNTRQAQNTELNLAEGERAQPELSSYPRRVFLELTTKCNARCVMCGRNAAAFKPASLSLEQIVKLSPILKHAQEVAIFGWGEPTIWPCFGALVNWLEGFGVARYVITNGMTLHKHFDAISRIELLAVSLDGIGPTNDAIRIGTNYSKIVENVAPNHVSKRCNATNALGCYPSVFAAGRVDAIFASGAKAGIT